MLSKFWTRVEDAERRFRRSWGRDVTSSHGRRWARLHYHLFDHAFLRIFWHNFWPVAPGVWRSNQPTHRRFEKYKAMGIRTVVNLRGEDKGAHYQFERESCEALGLKLVNAKLWARSTASRMRVLEMIEALRAAEKPFVFHCKSGADRAGFASAVYLIQFEGVPVAEARKQLGLKYVHLEFTKTGVQGYVLDTFAARLALGEITFEDWVRHEYRARMIQDGYDRREPPAKLAQRLMGSPS